MATHGPGGDQATSPSSVTLGVGGRDNSQTVACEKGRARLGGGGREG